MSFNCSYSNPCRSNEVNIGKDNCSGWNCCCCLPAPTPTPRPPTPTNTPVPPTPTPTVCIPPQGPALNTVDQSCQTSSTYTRNFSWQASSGSPTISYRFEISTNATYANPTPINAGSNTSVSNVTLNTGTTYYWRVRAQNACGCSYGTEYNKSVSSPCTGWVAPNQVTIYAYGTPLGGVYPQMELRIDDATVASWTVTGSLSTYTYTHTNPVVSSQVKVAFTNDAYNPPEDRNLVVDKIMIGSQTFETEAPSVYSTGTWDAATGCAPGYKQSEWLAC
ncbi:MAG: hypothetical protein FJ044_00525, partial [Candidatus Cloacimonetes bacterium]|nr:hypothetical protein [Candidatus Cloacimonadota bacterium]